MGIFERDWVWEVKDQTLGQNNIDLQRTLT